MKAFWALLSIALFVVIAVKGGMFFAEAARMGSIPNKTAVVAYTNKQGFIDDKATKVIMNTKAAKDFESNINSIGR